ncbi:hypothetical protein, partial [Pseudomonas viridiflava]|uniref:hypothetical protein n=1 Tax=Pseudomonas viridiflava TaxID=33069 RepID=UPI0019825A55
TRPPSRTTIHAKTSASNPQMVHQRFTAESAWRLARLRCDCANPITHKDLIIDSVSPNDALDNTPSALIIIIICFLAFSAIA